ncbi:hypothetical protein BH23BAC3_BH23BAC3_21980 [soil metagenome]
MRKQIGITFLCLIVIVPASVFSQIISEPAREGSSKSIFPIAGFTSDYGLFGGVVFQRIDYGESRRPYLSNTLIDVTGSTKGLWMGRFDHEQIEMFGRPIRNRTLLDLELNPIRSYFGIGNETEFSQNSFDEGLYFLNQRHALLSFQGRKLIITLADDYSLDGVLRLKGSYTTVSDRGADTRFFLDPPPEFENGWVNTVGIGLMVDSRDSEFDPRYGQRTEIGIDLSSSIFGSSYSFFELSANWKGFLTLTENTVLAQRVALKYNRGDTPFWELPALGSSRGLRGFALDRFMGDSSVLYMAELRQWLFSFFEDEIKLGAHLFYDTGRVFSRFDSDRLFSSWQNSWGAGAAVTLFNPDLIFRGEIGFSGEDYGIYAGVGYAF